MSTISSAAGPAQSWSPAIERATKTRSPGRYVALRAVAERWDCDRSTVRRNLEAAGVKAFCLGHGKHGIVRYLFQEVEDYERRCREP